MLSRALQDWTSNFCPKNGPDVATSSACYLSIDANEKARTGIRSFRPKEFPAELPEFPRLVLNERLVAASMLNASP